MRIHNILLWRNKKVCFSNPHSGGVIGFHLYLNLVHAKKYFYTEPKGHWFCRFDKRERNTEKLNSVG